MLEKVEKIRELSDRFIIQVKSIGNECAYTDCLIEAILEESEQLKIQYSKILNKI